MAAMNEARAAALRIGDKTAAERVFQQVQYRSRRVALRHSFDGDIEEFPTLRQVAAVMHALADYTHNQHMVSDQVKEVFGEDFNTFGRVYHDQAVALGRYFHALGDEMEWRAFEQEEKQHGGAGRD